jgi:hypothetical protein
MGVCLTPFAIKWKLLALESDRGLEFNFILITLGVSGAAAIAAPELGFSMHRETGARSGTDDSIRCLCRDHLQGRKSHWSASSTSNLIISQVRHWSELLNVTEIK